MTKAKGIVHLEGYLPEILHDAELQTRFGTNGVTLFLLHHQHNPPYYLCANEEEELVGWVQSLLVEIFRETAKAVDVDGGGEGRKGSDARRKVTFYGDGEGASTQRIAEETRKVGGRKGTNHNEALTDSRFQKKKKKQ